MTHRESLASFQLAPETTFDRARTARHSNILGNSIAMRQARELTRKSASASMPVLIIGETGTGKSHFAQAIHAQGRHHHKSFLTLDCAALAWLTRSGDHPLSMWSFDTATSAQADIGALWSAGTLYLDEVSELPPAEQKRLVQLLRFLDRYARIRIVAATHRSLEPLVEAGNFREDLYYRLAGYPIHLPPLRERLDDIPDLSRYFCREYGARHQRRGIELSRVALRSIQRYLFPGNVRELRYGIERAVLLCESNDQLTPEHLPDQWRLVSHSTQQSDRGESMNLSTVPLREAVADFETRLIVDALGRHAWNQTHTAAALGIPRRTLIDKMHRFDITPPTRCRD